MGNQLNNRDSGCADDLEALEKRHRGIEAALQAALSRFEAIFENTPMVAIQGYDPDGTIRHWNRACTELYGYDRSEALGRKMQDLLFTGEEVEKFEAIVTGIMETGRAAPEQEWRLKVRDGSFKWAFSSMFPVFESGRVVEIFCTDVDITPLKRTEEELRSARDGLERRVEERSSELREINQSLVGEIARRKKVEEALRDNQRFQSTLIGNLPGMVYRCYNDPAWTVEFLSEGCYELTGYDPEDLLDTGKFSYVDLVVPEDRQRAEQEVQHALQENRMFRITYRITTASGAEKWVYEQGRGIAGPEDGQGKIEGFITDVTERKRTEMALQEAKAQVELYLDLICHDINNMNQAGTGYLELAMEAPEVSPETRELLARTFQSLQDSSRLISNVSKLQRVRSGEVARESIDVAGVLSELVPVYEGASGRNILIKYHPVSGCMVIANELIKDVFSNILGNAVKHSGGDLEIGISLDTIYLHGGKYCRISIEDNGPGIDDELKARLFTRYQRGKTSAHGKGLGLYLVRTLVEDFHGMVWVEDRVTGDHSKGCRFVVMLPSDDDRKS